MQCTNHTLKMVQRLVRKNAKLVMKLKQRNGISMLANFSIAIVSTETVF